LKSERYQTLTRSVDHLQGLLQKDSAVSEAVRYQDLKNFAHATGDGLSEILQPNGTGSYPSPSAAALAFP
jgi:hypothetical protein